MTHPIRYTIIQQLSLVAVGLMLVAAAVSAQEPPPAKDESTTPPIKRDGKRTNGRNHETGIPPQIADGAGDFVQKGGGTEVVRPPNKVDGSWDEPIHHRWRGPTEVVRPPNKVDGSAEAERRESVTGSKNASGNGLELAIDQAAQRKREQAQSNFTFLLILAGGTVVLGLVWAVLALGRTRK